MTFSKLIECEEYSRIKIGFEVNNISPTELKRIETTWRAMTGRNASAFFEYGAGFVSPKNWTGAVASSDITLQVVPRGAKALPSQDKLLLDQNLNQMLRVALSKRTVLTSSTKLSAGKSRFEGAVEAFCDLVLLARRKRVLRSYQTHRETTRNCRGRLLFPSQSMNEIRDPGLFSSSWVDLGEDIPENRFLCATLDFCLRRCNGRVRRRVEEVLNNFGSVSITGMPLEEYRRIRFERLPKEYNEAISLAKGLLEGNAGGLFVGSLTSRAEIIFMPDLFQTFVSYLSREIAQKFNYKIALQRKGRHLGTWGSGPRRDHNCFEVIPDIELERPGSTLLIDAKWKILRPEIRDLGVNEADVYQMLTYSRRFNCEQAILVYPWIGRQPPFDEYPPVILITNGSQTIMKLAIVCIPLLWESLNDISEWLLTAITSLG